MDGQMWSWLWSDLLGFGVLPTPLNKILDTCLSLAGRRLKENWYKLNANTLNLCSKQSKVAFSFKITLGIDSVDKSGLCILAIHCFTHMMSDSVVSELRFEKPMGQLLKYIAWIGGQTGRHELFSLSIPNQFRTISGRTREVSQTFSSSTWCSRRRNRP